MRHSGRHAYARRTPHSQQTRSSALACVRPRFYRSRLPASVRAAAATSSVGPAVIKSSPKSFARASHPRRPPVVTARRQSRNGIDGTVPISSIPAVSYVAFKSPPAEATLTLDGKPVGVERRIVRPDPARSHRLVAGLKGYHSATILPPFSLPHRVRVHWRSV
jgi:hypothetical protein